MTENLVKLFKYWAPVAVWMFVIFKLSAISGKDMPGAAIPNLDKLAHFLEYLILGFLLIRAFLNSGLNITPAKLFILAVIISSLYAAGDEIHQRYVPDRTPDLFDFFTDFTGALFGVFIYKRRI